MQRSVNRYIIIVGIILYALFVSHSVTSAGVPKLSISKVEGTVGDRFTIVLDIESLRVEDTSYFHNFPGLQPGLQRLDSVHIDYADEISHISLGLTAFDSGSFQFNWPASTWQVLKQPAPVNIKFHINLVSVDTTKAFKDVMPYLSISEPWDNYQMYALILVLLVLIAISLWLYLKYRRRLKESKQLKKNEIALFDILLQDIDEWQLRGHPTSDDEVKKLYTSIHFSIRQLTSKLIHKRLKAKTTKTVMQIVRNIRLDPKAINMLSEILQTTDAVKFSKIIAIPQDTNHLLTITKQYVVLMKTIYPPMIDTVQHKND
ncbi:MAG: hypothetical protein SGJ04_08485 [Bacteroidota bacterium]|nr:hypothetical protein [Bacteroidota bacterium]